MRILIVEDNVSLAGTLQKGLKEEGFEVSVAGSVDAAEREVDAQSFQLVLLDLGLPGRDGLELLENLHNHQNDLPVIILTARGDLEDRVKGLTNGADDYVVKPFAFSELLARIGAVQRRSRQGRQILKIDDLEINPLEHRSVRDGRELELTKREFELLIYLAKNAGHVVSRETLAKDVWKVTSRATPLDNVIDVTISRLRGKLDLDTTKPSLLKTVRGVGYILGDSA